MERKAHDREAGLSVTELICNLLNQQHAPELDMDTFDGDPTEFHYFMAIFHEVQWNVPKAGTHWTKDVVGFRDASTLERFCLFWPETQKNPTPKTENPLAITIIPFTPPQ